MPALQARTNQDLKVWSIQYFFSNGEKKNLQKMGGIGKLFRDDCGHDLPYLSVRKDLGLNKPKAYFYSRKCIFYFLLILVQGFSLVENFDNTRLCGSAVSHARL